MMETVSVKKARSGSIRNYLIRKSIIAIILIFLILIFDFVLFRILPGNPIQIMFSNSYLTHNQYIYLEKQFGFDKPLSVQLLLFIRNVFIGNFGISYAYGMPVLSLIVPAILNSLILGVPATVIAIILGIYTGKLAAWKRGTKVDSVLTNTSMVLWAIPGYWLGGLLILVFVYVKGLPLSGMYTYGMTYTSISSQILDLLHHLILPLVTLTLVIYGSYTLVMRNTLTDVLTEDYIITARAKGVPENLILNRHAMPNAMLPMVSMIAIQIGVLVGGLMVIETVFSWPGIGWMIYQAIMGRDYPLLQGAFLILSISVVLANFIADLVYMYLDPRIKYV
ncbi:MAG: ABC transporter permease [Thermoplasmata archaeon]